jgi:hypothetical protein
LGSVASGGARQSERVDLGWMMTIEWFGSANHTRELRSHRVQAKHCLAIERVFLSFFFCFINFFPLLPRMQELRQESAVDGGDEQCVRLAGGSLMTGADLF